MSPRRLNDFYPTPTWATEVLLEHLPLSKDTIIYEPCSGQGDITKVLNRKFDIVLTNDIDPKMEAYGNLDATEDVAWTLKTDFCITNPPFNQAYQIVRQAVKHSREGVAMLLRLSFLEPTIERGPWLAANPPDKLLVLPRISFTGDGRTDSCTTAWMIWFNRHPKNPSIIVEPKRLNGRPI